MNTKYLWFVLLIVAQLVACITEAKELSRIETKNISKFKLSGVSLRQSIYQGEEVFKVTMPASSYQHPDRDILTDRALIAWLPIDFRNGSIELDLVSSLAADAPVYARGFIGVAFRIDPSLNFEGIYLRPVNSQAEDQIRRNHSTQYFSYPDFDFARLRREASEKYESYVDISMNTWIHIKIDVVDDRASLFVNRAKQATLIVKDLKHGPAQHGGIGFWIESGTIGYFKNVKILTKKE